MGYRVCGVDLSHGTGYLKNICDSLKAAKVLFWGLERFLKIKIDVNNTLHEVAIEANTLLVTVLRENLQLTGAHVGCDTSQCGACTVHLDGRAVKSCAVLALQVAGSKVVTIEGIGEIDDLHPMQSAFREHHALQCGFCTPGMIMQAIDLVTHEKNLDRKKIREGLEGNLCRCTGYHNIVSAIESVADKA
jgi:carbon-monoxide dehydrogenase small subunit